MTRATQPREVETHYYKAVLTGKPDRTSHSCLVLNATVAATRRLALGQYRVAYIRRHGIPLVKITRTARGIQIVYGEGMQ